MQSHFKWDDYSDQPYQLKDKNFKKKMRKNEIFSLIKTYALSIFILPLAMFSIPFIRRKTIVSNDFFSMGIDYQREIQSSLQLLEELNIDRIALRFKLWEMDSLHELKEFILECKNKKIILKIIQDRENIENLHTLNKNLDFIFKTLDGLVDFYEIGSTINRAKWGFFSVKEYNSFYTVAYNLKRTKYKDIQLMGSGVIDFEYHYTAHTLFNFDNYKYDAASALLYVDRRGAPENSQLGFNLSDKVALLSAMVWTSPKSKHKLHITEVNWPITNTAPYAPTSEFECVDLQTYTDYMLRYHFLVFASQQVDSISWHQLIAPGYGLVDNRDGIKKYPAFEAYKVMVTHLKHAQFLRLDIKRNYYILQCLVDNTLLQIHWSTKPTTLKNESSFVVTDIFGKTLQEETLNIGSTPIYIYIRSKDENMHS